MGNPESKVKDVFADRKKTASATTKDRDFAALSAYVIFLAFVQTATIAVSLAELPIAALVAWAILTVSAAAGGLAYSLLRRAHPEPADIEQEAAARGRGLSLLVVASAAACYIALWVLACLTPDLSCDGNTYHLPTIHIWAMKGHIHWIDPDYQEARFMNGYPKGVELMSFVLVRALGSNLVNTGNLAFLPLGVLAVACLARWIGASRPMSLLAGAAFVMIPVNIAQAATTYVDSAYASSSIAFIAAVVFVASHLGRQGSHSPWSALPILGASMGLAMAGKGTGGLIAAVGLTVLAVQIAARAIITRPPGRARSLASGIAFIVAASVIAAAVGGYWYMRNYLIMGSPLYPAGVTIAGHQVFPGVSVASMIGLEECTPAAIRSWPECLKVLFVWTQIGADGCYWPDTMWFLDSRWGGLGYIWLLGCVPAILAMLTAAVFRPAAGRRGIMLILLAVTGATFLATPMNWWARYTLWIYSLGLPCFAAAASWVADHKRMSPTVQTIGTSGENDLPRILPLSRILVRPARFWLAACILVLLLEGGLALLLNVAWAKCPNPCGTIYMLPALVGEQWRRPTCYMIPELNGSVFDEILTGDAPVAAGRLETRQRSGRYKVLILGQLSLPVGRRALLPLPEPVDDAAVAALRARGVRYVIWDDSLPLPEALIRAAEQVCRPPGFVVLVIR